MSEESDRKSQKLFPFVKMTKKNLDRNEYTLKLLIIYSIACLNLQPLGKDRLCCNREESVLENPNIGCYREMAVGWSGIGQMDGSAFYILFNTISHL